MVASTVTPDLTMGGHQNARFFPLVVILYQFVPVMKAFRPSLGLSFPFKVMMTEECQLRIVLM